MLFHQIKRLKKKYMNSLKNKKAIIIGFGGMGKRYLKALKNLKFNVTHICDSKKDVSQKNIIFEKNYKKLLKEKADIVCIVTNTTDRFRILKDFILNSQINNIVTEKPLCCSLYESSQIHNIINKSKKKLVINSYRPYLKNYTQIKKIAKKENEDFKSVVINSPLAGLGNMGSVFFDLGIFFLGKNIKSLFCKIDNTNTINPRGKRFKDPGGYGLINFSNNKRLIFDTSEDTGLPYIITIKTKNIEFIIDEINNNFYYKKRPKEVMKKPLNYYLYKPELHKLPIFEKYDPVKFTQVTLKNVFKKNFKSNLQNSIDVMKIIIGCHISSKLHGEVKYKILNKQKTYIKFA